ncbi:MAG: Maf family protein [Candidatus Marinimicrobia bacterium]|nr:Maf family protein [Candidatus Neomarinimicrobiota bacterium]MDD5582747.1 Maf family protein [Candidatus Neomarinimicrobiota bacterium]
MKSNSLQIILASSSPRRKDILQAMGFSVTVYTSSFDESSITAEKIPSQFAMAAAYAKGKDVSLRFPDLVTVSADTVVSLNGIIYGKPSHWDEAITMLKHLSGKTHSVITGLSLFYPVKKKEYIGFEETFVTFRSLTDDEIFQYIEIYKPYDKAGAYGIQDIAIPLVERIEGSYFNVVGFPVTHFYIHWRELVKEG